MFQQKNIEVPQYFSGFLEFFHISQYGNSNLSAPMLLVYFLKHIYIFKKPNIIMEAFLVDG